MIHQDGRAVPSRAGPGEPNAFKVQTLSCSSLFVFSVEFCPGLHNTWFWFEGARVKRRHCTAYCNTPQNDWRRISFVLKHAFEREQYYLGFLSF